MNQKAKRLVLAAGIAFAIIIIGIVIALVQIKEIRDIIDSGSITINGGHTNEANTQMEAPSILNDSNVDFAGKKSFSIEKGTIGVNISATPIEFKEGTRARVKVDGKNYKLKRKDNSFSTTFHVSAFKPIGPIEVIFEDGETVRSEYLADIGLSAFLPVNFTWAFDGAAPEFHKDKIVFDNKMILTSSEDSESTFSSARLHGEVDGKQVYKKTFKLANLTADSTDLAFDWEDEIQVPEGKSLVIYLETKDKYGLIYRYKFGQISKTDQGETFGNQDYQNLEVLNSKGKALFSEKVMDIFETSD